jgi:SNF2 family DNA or RNA helicase
MEEKDIKDKITNLLEGLANMSDADIEEAREILRKAGKNPDAVVDIAMKRLKLIQQRGRTAKKLSEFNTIDIDLTLAVIAFDSSIQKVVLSNKLTNKQRLLLASEAYSVFVQKDYRSLPAATDVSQVADSISFRKITRELFVSIDFTKRVPVVQFRFSKDDSRILSLRDVGVVTTTGYIIFEHIWYPVQQENLDMIKDIYAQLNEDGTIALKAALEYYFNSHKFPMVNFIPVEPSLETILANEEHANTPGPLFIRELYKYQKDGFKWFQHCCVTRTGGILGDDMGLGKTAQAISMITWAIEKKIFDRFLIVVPGTLLENWRREFDFFAPSIETYIHHGDGRTGSATLLGSKAVVITSYSMVVNDQYLLNKIDWDVIIADEASLVKNPDSERRNSLKRIPSKLKIVMTGTPVENSLMDLWSLADLTNEGFLGSRSEFSKRYIKRDIESTMTEGDLDRLKKDTALIMLRRKKEQVLDSLPERIDVHQALAMSESEAELYDKQRELILSKASNGAIILGLIQEMRKFTTHPFLGSGEDIEEADITTLSKSSVKFSRTIQLLDEIKSNREKVLIFTEYLDMIDAFARVFEKHYNVPVFTIDGRVPTEERQHNIDLFTAAKGFSIMVLNPRTAGMGLNITAANHVIHYTRQWNPALEEQATARAYRNKQTKAVNVYYLYYANTIEEVIDDRLRAKSKLSNEVITPMPEDLSIDEYLQALKLSPSKFNR